MPARSWLFPLFAGKLNFELHIEVAVFRINDDGAAWRVIDVTCAIRLLLRQRPRAPVSAGHLQLIGKEL
jgi:hypothetical protein